MCMKPAQQTLCMFVVDIEKGYKYSNQPVIASCNENDGVHNSIDYY